MISAIPDFFEQKALEIIIIHNFYESTPQQFLQILSFCLLTAFQKRLVHHYRVIFGHIFIIHKLFFAKMLSPDCVVPYIGATDFACNPVLFLINLVAVGHRGSFEPFPAQEAFFVVNPDFKGVSVGRFVLNHKVAVIVNASRPASERLGSV